VIKKGGELDSQQVTPLLKGRDYIFRVAVLRLASDSAELGEGVAVCCSVLQCNAVCYSVLQCVAVAVLRLVSDSAELGEGVAVCCSCRSAACVRFC